MMIAGTERRRQGCSLQDGKQWGFEETETKTIAFPISFESIKYVFLSKIYGPASGGADTVAYNFFRKSLTGVSFDYAYTRNWLAIGGKQPQWRNNPGLWAIPFTEFVAGGITMTRTGSQSSGTWYGDSGTISLTGYTASCATNESWVSNISGSAIAVGL